MSEEQKNNVETVKVAVYGTLRKGFWNYERFLEGTSKFLGEDQLKGFSMYGNKIPHVVKDNEDQEGVYVEIYEIPKTELPRLDSLEGYQEGRKQNTYERLVVKTCQGEAYIYVRGQNAVAAYGTSKDKIQGGIYNGLRRKDVLHLEATNKRVY